jgi:hypothetical protein
MIVSYYRMYLVLSKIPMNTRAISVTISLKISFSVGVLVNDLNEGRTQTHNKIKGMIGSDTLKQ